MSEHTKQSAKEAVEAFCRRRFDEGDTPPAVESAMYRLVGHTQDAYNEALGVPLLTHGDEER